MAREAREPWPFPNSFDIIGFSQIIMLRWKIFVLLLLGETKASNFIGKSLSMLALYTCHDAPGPDKECNWEGQFKGTKSRNCPTTFSQYSLISISKKMQEPLKFNKHTSRSAEKGHGGKLRQCLKVKGAS